jgi:Zn-dependent peptidase ImmA (M78 family)
MQISRAFLTQCFSEVNNISEIYRLNYLAADATVRSVDNLHNLCGTFLEKKVLLKFHKQRFSDSSVRGFYVNYPDRFEIVILQGQNKCWTRFVTCKELFHVILDGTESRTIDIEGLIDEFTISFLETEHSATSSAATEILAEVAAMEFLFPYENRAAALEKCNDDPENYMEIARFYSIPRVLVEKYLNKHFMDILDPKKYTS